MHKPVLIVGRYISINCIPSIVFIIVNSKLNHKIVITKLYYTRYIKGFPE